MRVDSAARSVVRVRAGDLAAGAGILLAPDLVATCAHVVADAVGEEYVPEQAPDVPVEVDLPLAAGVTEVVSGRVERWWPPQPDGTGDVAVLRLQRAFAAPVPSLRRVEQPWGRRFSAAGFPPGREDGQWASGVLREHQGAGWVQLTSDGPGPVVGSGFSGAPVIDVDAGCVVAMAVAADRDTAHATAYALPIDQVLTLTPQVLANPYRGLAAFSEQHTEFFFGRAADTARATTALDRDGVVVVAGGSGVGKSSLLRAGVAASERDRGRPIATARLTATTAQSDTDSAEKPDDDGATADHDDVAEQLAAALSAAVPGNWAQLLRSPDDSAGAAEFLVSSTPQLPGHPTPPADGAGKPAGTTAGPTAVPAGLASVPAGGLVLVLDQLEELASAAPESAQKAVDALLRLWRAGVRVAVTARWATFDVLTGPAGDWLRGAAIGVSALDRDGLRSAVAEPARRTPGPSFAPGLAERIVDDAGDEPGRLPLVQALLAELWDHPDGALLTERAYDTAGRVDGALVVSADRTWDTLNPADQAIARRLILAMTRPADGGFVRAPLPQHALSGPERRVIETLVRQRLVTISTPPGTENPRADGPGSAGDESAKLHPTAGDGDVAELAHQALIDHWPLLKGWLVDDADFLRWRDELRGAAARWTAGRDPGRLLRGRALDTALGWDDTRRGDLDTNERTYLDASRRRATRDRRLRRGAITGLATLLVLALVLSVVLAQSNSSLTRSLAAANARTLGQLALSQLATDPAAGTQLALAAYAADPDSADARSALGQAYLARRSTIATRTIPGAGQPTGLVVDPDIDITAFPAPIDAAGGGGGVVVGDGLQGDAPTYATVPGSAPGVRPVAVGGRGRWIVTADAGGQMSVWDRTSPTPARPITSLTAGPVTSAEITPDGANLITLTRTAAAAIVHVVDLATAAAGPAIALQDPTITRVWQTTDPTRLLAETGAPNATGSHLSVRDARTGAVLQPIAPTAAVAGQGASTVRCETLTGAPATITIDDAATGTTRRRINGDGDTLECDAAAVSADGRHVVLRSGQASTTVTPVKVFDIDTGRRGLAWVPTATGVGAFRTSTAFGGTLSTTTIQIGQIAVRGDRGLLLNGAAVDTIAFDTNQSGPAELGGQLLVPPRADYVLVAYTDGVLAAGPRTTKPLGDVDLPDDQPLQAGIGNDLASLESGISAHQIALVIAPTGRPAQIRDYSLPQLQPLGEYDLAGAGASGTPGTGRFGSFVQIGRSGDNTAILSGGVLSWWSPEHRLLGPPTTLSTNPATTTALVDTLNDGLSTITPAAGQAAAGTDAVAIREPDGVGIYRPNSPPTRIRADLIPQKLNQQLRLTPDRLVTIEQPGNLVQRDPATGAVTAPPLPISPNSYLIGTDSADRLITYDDASATIRIWDLRADKPAGDLVLPENTVDFFIRGQSADGIWPINTGDQVLRLPVDASAWHTKLCTTQNRAFTDTERTLLPDGADSNPPCRSE